MGQEDPLEEGMATHTSNLTWRLPMNRGAWQAADHGVTESDTTVQLDAVPYSWWLHNVVNVLMSPNSRLKIFSNDKYNYEYFTLWVFVTGKYVKKISSKEVNIPPLCLWNLCLENPLYHSALLTPVCSSFRCRLSFFFIYIFIIFLHRVKLELTWRWKAID